MGWASAHPWLTVLFVLPALFGFPIALVRALKPKDNAVTRTGGRFLVNGESLQSAGAGGASAGIAGPVVVDAAPTNDGAWLGVVMGVLATDGTVIAIPNQQVTFGTSAIVRRIA